MSTKGSKKSQGQCVPSQTSTSGIGLKKGWHHVNVLMTQKLLSVTQYAKRFRISPQAVRKAIKEKRIKAERVGEFWVIPQTQCVWFHDGKKIREVV